MADLTSWCVLEAELVDLAVGAGLRIFVRELLTPRTRWKAGESRVVLVPLGDKLLEVCWAYMPCHE